MHDLPDLVPKSVYAFNTNPEKVYLFKVNNIDTKTTPLTSS